MSDDTEVKALLESIANRQIKEYALGAKRDKDAAELKADVQALKARVDRIDATATGARQSVSDLDATHAFETQALQNRFAALEGKLDTAIVQTTRVSEDIDTGAKALTAGGTKQQTATRTSILVAVLFALGQLIQLWRGH